MRIQGFSIFVCGLVIIAAACGDDSTPPTDSGASDTGIGIDSGTGDSATDSGGGDGATDSGTGDGATDSGGGDGGTSACPTEPPSGACRAEGLECEYGDDPRLSCRTFATCTSGTWMVTTPRCTPLPDVMCPPTRDDAAGEECRPEDAYCSYDGLACRCTNCIFYPVVRCGGPFTWRCDAPNPDMQCPPARPRLGDTCGLSDGTQCVYGCEGGESRTCEGGLWVSSSAPGGCPISTRRAKQHIRYVDAAEAHALAAEVLDVRLASYEYIDPALRGTRRLGFILEDRPTGSYAGDPSSSQVDLYGYTSMLVATVQEQQRALDELRREVRSLRRAVRNRR